MAHNIEHLRREIEELERQISSHPFEGLFDRKRLDQMHDKLKKKRKELSRLESGDDVDEMEHSHHQIEIPEFVADVDAHPDLADHLDLDEEPVKRVAPVRPAASVKSPIKVAAPPKKAVKKVVAKPKPKPKSKPAPKKKTVKRAAKKKSKR